MNVIAKRVKRSWEDQKNNILALDVYSYEKTKNTLLANQYYKTLFGRGKNRTLYKEDPILYKSIFYYTKDLEVEIESFFKDKISKASIEYYYSFSKRVKYIVEHNCNISKLKCKCGKSYTWNTYCRKCPEYHNTQSGKKHSKESILKMRISTLKYIEQCKGQIYPRYNKNSIKIIENFGKENGYSFMHAENGGEYHVKELGYFLDAYDPHNNIVLEIDEKHHYDINGDLLEKDANRQKEIQMLLNCEFYRIKL
jgi:hypothetical protein